MEEFAFLQLLKNKEITAEIHRQETVGDKDLLTSLLDLGKTDFFTKELDEALLQGEIDIALHSAKDLPDPLPEGLVCIHMTESIDPRDALVLRDGYEIGKKPVVGVSSPRRVDTVKRVWRDAVCKDIRGTIERRLFLLDSKEYDAVVVAEAALIRLGLTGRRRMYLPGETAEHQGRLAIVCRSSEAGFYKEFFDEQQQVFA